MSSESRRRTCSRPGSAVATGFERTNVQDVGFGFRQLVDVAARALSPGINDPTTAVHVIGHLSVLLCQLAERNLGAEHLTDADGQVRVVTVLPDLRDLLEMGMNQTRQYGAADSAVTGRLLQLLQELSWCNRKGRYRAEILDHLGRLRSSIAAAGFTSAERSSLIDQADVIESGQQGHPS